MERSNPSVNVSSYLHSSSEINIIYMVVRVYLIVLHIKLTHWGKYIMSLHANDTVSMLKTKLYQTALFHFY